MAAHEPRLFELLEELFGPSLEAVIDARLEQIRAGHDSDADDAQPTVALLGVADRYIINTRELVQDGRYRNLPVAEKRIARAAAVLLATFDRVRRERLREEQSATNEE